jgi:hypothetical protein
VSPQGEVPKAERYQRIMTEELLYAREYASEDERSHASPTSGPSYS